MVDSKSGPDAKLKHQGLMERSDHVESPPTSPKSNKFARDNFKPF